MKILNFFKSKKREIILSGYIDSQLASTIVSMLLVFDDVSPHEDIKLIIDSPGGNVTSAFAIYDAIRHIKSDVNTVVLGKSTGMALLISSAGAKGKRVGMEHSTYGLVPFERINNDGKYSDKQISEWIDKLEANLYSILSELTGQKADKIKNDVESGLLITAEEALNYGFIDIIY